VPDVRPAIMTLGSSVAVLVLVFRELRRVFMERVSIQ
jgi:hypothetical protein